MSRSTGEIASAYWREYQDNLDIAAYARSGQPPRPIPSADTDDEPEADWADWAVTQAVRVGGVEAVDLLVVLANTAPDQSWLGYLGAGPLEDLIRWHGLPLAEELDRALDAEPNLRIALRSVRIGVETLDADTRLVDFFFGPRRSE